jgi:hypothetical protein
MTVIRDVSIIEITPSADWTYQNWTLKITVVAKNQGNLSESFDIKLYYNETLITTCHITNLPPANTQLITVDWNTTGVKEGIYVIKAEASQVPYEYNITNNVLYSSPIVVLAKIRDIGINSISLSRDWAFPGMIINITVSVENFGEFNESFILKIYRNETLIVTRQVSELPAKTQLTIAFLWNTSGLTPCNSFVIKAETSLIQYEYNITNNMLIDGTVKIRVLGDVNGDGKTEAKDIALVAKAFGSYPGHPRWNPDADVTSVKYLVPDGYVDVRDLALICKNFGRKC